MMLDNYLIVHKNILPDYYEKVLNARNMIEDGEAKDVSDAVKKVGISRSTYYKYKDYILKPTEINEGKTAVISVMLSHEPGTLSALLTRISEVGGSIITITQSIPIRNKAEVTISMDVGRIEGTMDELLAELGKTPGADRPKLLAIE